MENYAHIYIYIYANDRFDWNSKVISWQKKAETSFGVTDNVLRCDSCTVSPQDKDVTPEDKVSLKSILNKICLIPFW